VSGRNNRNLVVALSGGIGGAKLALGLSRVLAAGDLMVVANTGDDFAHLGLSISPDLDTLLYTLAALDDPHRGWGRRDETWTFMAALAKLGGETWFQLGDGDLATHIERTRRLCEGESLSAITADFCRRLAIATRIVPMTDDKVRTRLRTPAGWLDFQDYFVRQRCAPKILEIGYDGAAAARAHPDVLAVLRDPRLRAVIICPSNPYLSIAPMLAISGLRDAIAACGAPVVAVSPIIGGRAVKGPTAKMMTELGLPASATAVALYYAGLLDAYVIDHVDAALAAELSFPVTVAHTLMLTLEDRDRLARDVLAAADASAKATVQSMIPKSGNRFSEEDHAQERG
jgi:LPPG:FO 2-phospho-L-lactate transferase